MEQFNIPHQKIREKSVYLVHLDAARIAVLSAAVIGIIIASFLLGMNFVRGGEGDKNRITKGDVFDAPRELDLLKGNIPGQPDMEELSRSADEKLLSLDRLDLPAPDAKEEKTPEEPANLLTKENIAPPVHQERTVEKKAAVSVKKKSRVKDASYSARSKERSAPEKKTARKSGSQKVVAVSGNAKKPGGEGLFTVQVASYDTLDRASSEVGALKRLQYDAYVDETRVDGKRYFRVRVGRSASKVRALELLQEIQGVEKYRESYMVRE